ncbi:MAG TPA: MgtC/SapB family protein [Firmicutes bacterium]|jgi:putative Mg2+ transporter-C (MgtC) family protein|nr:MgtC/SapB family protein [Bacillota bacterium]
MGLISYQEVAFRLFLALLFGGIVGFERESQNRPAGFRTHILVSVGSALVMLVSAYGFSGGLIDFGVKVDPSRIAAQVVTGVGFLGAGTILRHGNTVIGLTTAATLWLVSGIGLAVGIGFYLGAALATLAVLISLIMLRGMDSYFARKRCLRRLWVKGIYQPGLLGRVGGVLGELGIFVVKVDFGEAQFIENLQENVVTIDFVLKLPSRFDTPDFLQKLAVLEGIIGVGWEGDELLENPAG